MLRIGLLLILAQIALAAPSVPVTITQYSENEIGPIRNDGRSCYLTRKLFDLVDGGEFTTNVLQILSIINDLSNRATGQALAYGQSLAVIGELASGYAGDACAPNSLIQAYTSTTPGAIRQGLLNYIRQLANNIDLIVKLARDPSSVKYDTGARGGCIGGGRTYNFESIWNINLRSATPSTSSLFREEYCAAKRLYSAFNSRSNNIGATLTAATTPAVQRVFNSIRTELINLLRALAVGKNRQQAASVAKNALLRAAARVPI